MAEKVKIGVIGVGTIGKAHLKGYATYPDAEVVAISDVNPNALETAKAEYHIPFAYKDYRRLLARKDILGVSVCTPPFNHAEIAVAAAKAGKHVLCEKPMCMNADEAQAMVNASREAGVKLGICSARSRFSAEADAAREYVLLGKLGDVYYARITSFRRRGRPGIDILKQSHWFLNADLAGGGALFDVGCYDIDLILYLLGSPKPLSVSAITYRGIPHNLPAEVRYDVEEHITMFVRFAGGTAVTFEKAWAVNNEATHVTQIFGSLGGLRLHPFTFYTEENGEQKDIQPQLPPYAGGNLFSDFVNACRTDALPKTPGEDGLLAMQISDAAFRSAREDREVAI